VRPIKRDIKRFPFQWDKNSALIKINRLLAQDTILTTRKIKRAFQHSKKLKSMNKIVYL